jgi:hypothetical protein
MRGSVLWQLANYGAQDVYLQSNLDISMWRSRIQELKRILQELKRLDSIPENLEYTCPITLEDITESKEDRIIILQHVTANNTICCPKIVFSKAGYDQMVLNNCACIYCHTVLNQFEDFAII